MVSAQNLGTPAVSTNFLRLAQRRFSTVTALYATNVHVSEELQVIKEVCEKLDTLKIEYMITGSIAANYYSTPRMTRDIDIVIELPASDVQRLSEAFEANYYIDSDTAANAVSHAGMFHIIHNGLQIKVDFICRKDSVYRKKEFDRKQRIDLGGFSIWIVSLEDLILSKLAWAKDSQSEMQIRDVVNLIKSADQADIDYLKRWAADLGVSSTLEEALK